MILKFNKLQILKITDHMCKSNSNKVLMDEDRNGIKMGMQGEWRKEWVGKEGKT